MTNKKYYAFCLLLMTSCLSLLAQSPIKVKVYQDCSRNGFFAGEDNGHQWVDLGLSVKWATCNLGASKPEEYGYYYAWGEVTTKTTYSWSTYKWCNGSYESMNKYCIYDQFDSIDNKSVLEKDDDAASYNWRGNWRMPTQADLDELQFKCTREWTEDYNGTGISGSIFTGPNGNSMFLPAAGQRLETGVYNDGQYGYYWSSSLGEGKVYDACCLDFNYEYFGWCGYGRDGGFTVRPVIGSALSAETATDTLLVYADSCETFNTITASRGATIEITAEPESQTYRFVRWQDGNTENPRRVVLNGNKIIKAIFGHVTEGKCGENLRWTFIPEKSILIISGNGAMDDYAEAADAPWFYFKNDICQVVFNDGITHIGNNAFREYTRLKDQNTPNSLQSVGINAFYGCIYLKKVTFGVGLTNIGANAFGGCNKLFDIYCYAEEAPIADQSSFSNYNVYLYPQCEYKRNYELDVVFGNFKFIQCIGAEEGQVESNRVVVSPHADEAVITWPKNGDASTYTVKITKDGKVCCTLTFSNTGQLLGIDMAPSRDSRKAQFAESVADGFQFTITGLDGASAYSFVLEALDAEEKVVAHYEGEFTTEYQEFPTALDNVKDGTSSDGKCIRNGQLYILRGGIMYNAQGMIVE